MRLLNLQSWDIKEFQSTPPAYYIASHRWTEEELTFQEVSEQRMNKNKSGYKKLESFCRAALKLNASARSESADVFWIWIDTCCIDKTNSVELQEALNSMFRWYAEARACLALLHDVGSLDREVGKLQRQFRRSVYFKRGWTLQELLAPKLVVFYNHRWDPIGHKVTKDGEDISYSSASIGGIWPANIWVGKATNIPDDVLADIRKVERYSVAERRSWMRGRQTTRVEDQVYCQLGIFGIFMPLIYGEGEHAMIRFEEALVQKQRREQQAGPAGWQGLSPTPAEQVPALVRMEEEKAEKLRRERQRHNNSPASVERAPLDYTAIAMAMGGPS